MTTPAKPFVTRDVFRLLMRLEAQKTNEVDAQLLERRFHVPHGYGRDETDEQRERLSQLITPGPGAYEPHTIWKGGSNETTKPSAVFSSSAPRDPFQLEAIEKEAAQLSSQRVTRAESPSSTYLQPPPPLGSFAKSQRGLDSPEGRAKSPQPNQTEIASSPPVKKWASPGVSFERAPRATHAPVVPACPLGPSQYEIKRLWDKSRQTGVATPDLPSAAFFSASKGKRELVWSPAHGLPSNAVAEAWNASPHYAKHKRQVLLEQEKQRRRQEKAQQSRQQLPQSKSMPVLGSPSKVRGKKHGAETHTESALDPFDWLRRLPHGEQRANALAVKHGLSELVRPAAANSTKRVLQDGEAAGLALIHALHAESDDSSVSESTSVAPLAPIGKHAKDEDEGSSSRRGLYTTADENQANSSQGNERISVSCRLQGGCVITVKIYPAKRVRHLKTAIVRKQTRYQNEDQFDLYLGNGKLLTSMEDTLHQVGLRDRSLVQVVSK